MIHGLTGNLYIKKLTELLKKPTDSLYSQLTLNQSKLTKPNKIELITKISINSET